MPADKAGLAWGMKEGSSQAHQMLAALKSYGLVAYEGASRDRKAVVTDEARTYLRAQQEQIKKQVIREAALKPKLFKLFQGIWGGQRVPDEVRIDELVLQHGFTESAARTFLRVYDDTLEFAELTDGVEQLGDASETPEDVPYGAHSDLIATPSRPHGASSTDAAPQQHLRPTYASTATEGWTEEQLIDDSGHEIRILYRGKPSEQRYEYIRDYLDFKISRLRKLGD
ncbi:hypothetical protein [Rhizobium sp. BK251]|uniref:hypothetical protein n=1 Tax=Rhizobium sp. BK251 TaxID=2512125 RepID=UPI0014052932|nr:hypothetical protein [Rhizobium sp. BK251]